MDFYVRLTMFQQLLFTMMIASYVSVILIKYKMFSKYFQMIKEKAIFSINKNIMTMMSSQMSLIQFRKDC